jgi:ABC-2 type transport system permease protein
VLAKIEAVLGAIALVFAPFVVAMAVISPFQAAVAGIGVFAAAISASAIQLWFRAQARRSHFRRRQTSSRLATFAEAFSSIAWASTAGFAAAESPHVVVMGAIALLVLGISWLISPPRRD